MKAEESFYPEVKFGGFTDIDGTIVFFNRVNTLLRPTFTVLDVGCGRGAYGEDPVNIRRDLRIFKGKVAKVIGVDVDPDAGENPYLDEFHLIQGDTWPVPDNSVDLIVCDNVLEHVPNPDLMFMEMRRVLKDGGYLCIRTPNRWSYVALAASLIPNKYHSKVTSVAQEGRKEEDVFPTLYRCNTARKLEAMMKKMGIEGVAYGYEAEPSYLAFSGLAYFFGVLHQKFSPGLIKPALFAFGKMKKSGNH
jgi:SAM-dependent methyltransferase